MSEISDYLNDLFSGRKPIRRENPKPGQSGWYYMMPKSDDDYTDYDFIDVPDENTPNPRLQQSIVNQPISVPMNQSLPQSQNMMFQQPSLQGKGIAKTLLDIGEDFGNGVVQAQNSLTHLYNNYKLMKSHNYKYLDDYYHCKANYQGTKEGPVGQFVTEVAGDIKELIDYGKNRKRGFTPEEALEDFIHDRGINQIGRDRFNNGMKYLNASEACRDYRDYNTKLPYRFY